MQTGGSTPLFGWLPLAAVTRGSIWVRLREGDALPGSRNDQGRCRRHRHDLHVPADSDVPAEVRARRLIDTQLRAAG